MPLRKYRAVEDMPSTPWTRALDPANLRRAGDVSGLAARLHPRHFPPGLYKYRTIGEASEARRQWELEDATPAARE